MKITIDLEDFWTEGDDNALTDSIRNAIIQGSINQVKQNLKPTIDKFLNDYVNQQCEAVFKQEVERIVKEAIENKKVFRQYSSDEPLLLEHYILKKLPNMSTEQGRNLIGFVEKKASDITSGILKNYNERFVNEIVLRLGKSGVLKDDFLNYITDQETKNQ